MWKREKGSCGFEEWASGRVLLAELDEARSCESSQLSPIKFRWLHYWEPIWAQTCECRKLWPQTESAWIQVKIKLASFHTHHEQAKPIRWLMSDWDLVKRSTQATNMVSFRSHTMPVGKGDTRIESHSRNHTSFMSNEGCQSSSPVGEGAFTVFISWWSLVHRGRYRTWYLFLHSAIS